MTKEEKKKLKEEKKRLKLEKKAQKKRLKEDRKSAKKNRGKDAGKTSDIKGGAAPRYEKDPVTDTKGGESQTKDRERPKNYHISKRDDGKWQVKFAKGERALKLFDTQAEAIAFAKEKAENQDGSITIHKKDGKIRKQRY